MCIFAQDSPGQIDCFWLVEHLNSACIGQEMGLSIEGQLYGYLIAISETN